MITVVDEWFRYASMFLDKLLAHSKRPLFAFRLYCLTYILQVAKDLREEKCDIVHVHNFSQFVPTIRKFNSTIKIVLHMTCEWLTQLEPVMIERRLRETDLILGCSEYIAEKIRLGFPQFAESCLTIHNGVDVDQFVRNKDQKAAEKNGVKRLLFFGRVSPEKGLHLLLDAFQEVVKSYPEVQLKIVGPHGSAPIEFIVGLSDDPKVSGLASYYRGSYLSKLRGKLSPSLKTRVFFTGFIPRQHLINYNQNADVFIFPSVWNEPSGMPIVEAMAAGVPLVATRVGGITEIVEEGKTGRLVEPNNAPALAEAILRLISDEDLMKSMGRAGRKRTVELFSWEKTAEKLLGHYEKICEGNERGFTRASYVATCEDRTL